MTYTYIPSISYICDYTDIDWYLNLDESQSSVNLVEIISWTFPVFLFGVLQRTELWIFLRFGRRTCWMWPAVKSLLRLHCLSMARCFRHVFRSLVYHSPTKISPALPGLCKHPDVADESHKSPAAIILLGNSTLADKWHTHQCTEAPKRHFV